MSRIIDASSVDLEGKRVLFDTNIWMLINGIGTYVDPVRSELYSAAHKKLLENGNTIIVNNYVLGEFSNKFANLEYRIRKDQIESAGGIAPSFKRYRRLPEFRSSLELIREHCVEILDESEFISIDGHHYDIRSVVNGCCERCADFSDLMLIAFCKKENLFIMTDDADYANCGLDIITGNRRIRALQRR